MKMHLEIQNDKLFTSDNWSFDMVTLFHVRRHFAFLFVDVVVGQPL